MSWAVVYCVMSFWGELLAVEFRESRGDRGALHVWGCSKFGDLYTNTVNITMVEIEFVNDYIVFITCYHRTE